MARWMRGEASDPTVWRRVQAAGRRVQASDTKRVSAKLGLGPCQMRVSLDGVMGHGCGEGWKEVKLGCVFEVVALTGAGDRSPLLHVNHAGSPMPDRKACRQSFVWYLGEAGRVGRAVEGRGRRAAPASRCGHLGHHRWDGGDVASGQSARSGKRPYRGLVSRQHARVAGCPHPAWHGRGSIGLGAPTHPAAVQRRGQHPC